MLGIVLINYHNNCEVINYLKHELSKIKAPYVIAIIDNSCSPEEFNKLLSEVELLGTKNIPTHVINAKENLGYAKANNMGAKLLVEKYNVDYILFSNSDIHFTQQNVVEYLIDKIKENSNVVAANPKILGQNNIDQTPHRYISFSKRYIFPYLFLPLLFMFLRRGFFSTLIRNAKFGYYYKLSGAFLLVKSKEFFELGMFDTNTFLYAEESILAEKINLANKKSLFIPDVSVIHNESSNIGTFYSENRIFKLKFSSNCYYYKKYKNTSRIILGIGHISVYVFLYVYMPFLRLIKSLLIKNNEN